MDAPLALEAVSGSNDFRRSLNRGHTGGYKTPTVSSPGAKLLGDIMHHHLDSPEDIPTGMLTRVETPGSMGRGDASEGGSRSDAESGLNREAALIPGLAFRAVLSSTPRGLGALGKPDRQLWLSQLGEV